jgi:putative oxidoreductase
VTRLGLGVMLIFHGYPRLFGGPDRWRALGAAMGQVGIDALPAVWGFIAAFALFGGGVLFILGLFFRLASLLLLVTLLVAVAVGWSGRPLTVSPELEAAFVAFGLLFLGPGRHSVDRS